MKWKLLLLSLLFLVQPTFAKHKYLEKEYQKVWCNACGGIQEYKLDDKTRVDCLLPEYAVEFDFANRLA